MVQVELTLETGQLIDIYLMVTTDGADFIKFLSACGQTSVAEDLRRKRNPAFDLDELIGTRLEVFVPCSGFITEYHSIQTLNAKRS